ncbi:hypothetical protein SRIMM317S_05738 [Streptomyces rimosus subsp. rimosus]
MTADGPAEIVLDGGTLRYLAANQMRTLDLGAAVTSRWAPAAAQNAAFSPDARLLGLVWSQGPTARFETRGTRSGAIVDRPPGMRLPPNASREGQLRIEPDELLSFSADGTRLAYGVSGDYAEDGHLVAGRVAVRDVPGHRDLTAVPGGQDNSPTEGAVLSPDGSRLITSSVRSVQMWDIGGGRREKSVSVSGGSPMTVRPDGRLLVVRGEIVRLPAGTVAPRRLTRQDTAYAFSPAGNAFAVGEETGHVALWDGGVERRFGRLPAFTEKQLPRHEAISALAFSPDGRTLAVAGAYGSLQLWDVPSQQPLGSALPTPGDKILSLTFNRDGSALYAAGQHVPLDEVPHRAGRPRRRGVPPGRWLAVPCGLGDVHPGSGVPEGVLSRRSWRLALAFGWGGTGLYAAGQHVPLTRYRIASVALVAEVCRRAGGSLFRADWETYRKVC